MIVLVACISGLCDPKQLSKEDEMQMWVLLLCVLTVPGEQYGECLQNVCHQQHHLSVFRLCGVVAAP